MNVDGWVKVIYSGTQPDMYEPRMSMIEDPGVFAKKAAASGFDYAAMTPGKDQVGIHLIALGEFEKYGSNRNGDSFPKEACVNYHDTFVKHGHLHRHHRNKPDDEKLGKVAASHYNPDMGRIELYVFADKEACAPELAKLEKNGEVPFSMACKVQYDRCNACNTLRKSAKDDNQCDHIKYSLGKMAEDGTVYCTHNDEPDFFDISFVYRPADRIAWSLKQASCGDVDSIKLAEDMGYSADDLESMLLSQSATQKRAAAKRLADMHDRYFAMAQKGPVTGEDHLLWELRKAGADRLFHEYDEDAVIELRKYDPADVFMEMAKRGMVMDVRTFLKYAMGSDMGPFAAHIGSIEAALPGIWRHLIKTGEISDIAADESYDVDWYRPVERPGLRKLLDRSAIASANVKSAGCRAIERSISGLSTQVALPGNFDKNLASPFAKAAVMKYTTYKLAAAHAVTAGLEEARQMALLAAQDLVTKTS